jgi:hypothetical protein
MRYFSTYIMFENTHKVSSDLCDRLGFRQGRAQTSRGEGNEKDRTRNGMTDQGKVAEHVNGLCREGE